MIKCPDTLRPVISSGVFTHSINYKDLLSPGINLLTFHIMIMEGLECSMTKSGHGWELMYLGPSIFLHKLLFLTSPIDEISFAS